MSKFVKLFAALALIAGIFAVTPNVASARPGGWHGGGWHGGGWHHGGGWRGGGWRGGGWGWGPGLAFGFGLASPYYYGGPYYAQAPACGWVRVRVWRNGHRVLRRVWRCW